MKFDSPLFDRIRVKPGQDRRLRRDHPGCDWPGCAAAATHRAPKGRLREGEYWRFCLEHVREYKHSYNYFAGMSDDALARYRKEAVTGRIGVAFDRALIYAKGGIAFADEDHFIGFNGQPFGAPSNPDTNRPGNTRTGWTLGAGLEWALWDNWSAKVEYNFMDFGTDNVAFTYRAGGSAPGLVERWDIDQQVHVVKLGINYRFGAAPLMARY